MKNIIRELLPYVLILGGVILIRTFIVTPVIVSGDSMKPNLHNGDLLLERKIGYNSTNIKKYLGIVTFSPELLVNTIHQNFNPGEKYSLSNLKVKLGDLYSSISYTAVPKANDILNYFEIKEYMTTEVVDGKKKRVRGYELLKRKDN